MTGSLPPRLRDSRHVIVARFSVPRVHDRATAHLHGDAAWLESRLALFRAFFVPSVARLGVPVVLLCSSASAPRVASAVDGLPWVHVLVQDDWRGGWSGVAGQTLTRLDSDDVVHERWFDAVDAAPPDAEVCCTREFLRYDVRRARLCAYRRRVPSPLAAFRDGRNPYAVDHAGLERRYRAHFVPGGPYLLQVFSGENVSSRRPSWYRPRLPLDRLREFGLRSSPFAPPAG